MKTSVITNILVSTMFYTTLLATTFVMPLVLASRGDPVIPAPIGDAQAWETDAATPPNRHAQRDRRLPQTDAPVSGPGARPTPVDKSGPDAAMIRTGKVRAKTIKA